MPNSAIAEKPYVCAADAEPPVYMIASTARVASTGASSRCDLAYPENRIRASAVTWLTVAPPDRRRCARRRQQVLARSRRPAHRPDRILRLLLPLGRRVGARPAACA